MSVPESFTAGPFVWCLCLINTKHKANRKPLIRCVCTGRYLVSAEHLIKCRHEIPIVVVFWYAPKKTDMNTQYSHVVERRFLFQTIILGFMLVLERVFALSICTTYSLVHLSKKHTWLNDWYNLWIPTLWLYEMALCGFFTNSSLFQGFRQTITTKPPTPWRITSKHGTSFLLISCDDSGTPGRFGTAFMNPLCQCSPRKFICSTSALE